MTAKTWNTGMAHTVFNAVDAHVALELGQNAHQNKIQIVNRVCLITTTPTLLDMRDVSCKSLITSTVFFSKVYIDQFRYIKILPKTIDLSTRLWGITTEFVGLIPQSVVLRSIVLGWISNFRNWSIIVTFFTSKQIGEFVTCNSLNHVRLLLSYRIVAGVEGKRCPGKDYKVKSTTGKRLPLNSAEFTSSHANMWLLVPAPPQPDWPCFPGDGFITPAPHPSLLM